MVDREAPLGPNGRSRSDALLDVLKEIATSDHADAWSKALAKGTIDADAEEALTCPGCGQPMLPPGEVKRPHEYDHARGCPRAMRGVWRVGGTEDRVMVEAMLAPAVIADGTTISAYVICDVLPTEARDGVPPRTALENARIIARALNDGDKAERYERDWYEAKSEFGEAMAKMRAKLRAAAEASDRLRTIIDEHFGMQPVMTDEEALSLLERKLFESRCIESPSPGTSIAVFPHCNGEGCSGSESCGCRCLACVGGSS